MRRFLVLCLLWLCAAGAYAQHDSVDVLNYSICLDLGHQTANRMTGHTTLRLQLLCRCDSITLDFKSAHIDSVCYNGEPISGYSHRGQRLCLPTADYVPFHPFDITVYYNKGAYVESYNWGGFHFNNDIYYNLGVAFQEYPHNFGRAWFPCRDNFTDKATYDLTITTKPGWTAQCGGIRQQTVTHNDGSQTSYWRLAQECCTYLVSVSAAPWHTIERTYTGLYGTYPATLAYTTHDSTAVYHAYEAIEEVLPKYEQCFGPYRWGRIGYVATPKGSMEHATNIGLVSSCMADMSTACQSVIAHEFAHAWFGNLVTCASSEDMWINEGGATFCEELAVEATANREAATNYYQSMLESVLRTTHHSDGDYLALHGVDPAHTYGNTSYQKGAMVWHSLRGYLGDSLFYHTMRCLFDRCAFASVDAYQLRDSLSLYSGTNLTDFFNFHVFGTGFLDYYLHSMQCNGEYATVRLQQRLVGTTQHANGNRVPLTFYSADMDTCQRWLYFDGDQGEETFQLPFEAAFVVIDKDKELSDAVTDELLTINNTNQLSLSKMHCKLKATQIGNPAMIHLAMHWTTPPTDGHPYILRLAPHYWTVNGMPLTEGTRIRAQFEYSRRKGGNAADGYLDEGFYSAANTLDSIRLLYRANADEPWQAVSSQHTDNTLNGYFTTDNLQLGEYTLGVVDTANMAIAEPMATEANAIEVAIYPNPTADGTLKVAVKGLDERYSIAIYDTMGHAVFQKDNLRNDAKLQPRLAAGTYYLQLRSNSGTLFHTEQLIVAL